MPRNYLWRGMGAGDHSRRIAGHQPQTQEVENPDHRLDGSGRDKSAKGLKCPSPSSSLLDIPNVEKCRIADKARESFAASDGRNSFP